MGEVEQAIEERAVYEGELTSYTSALRSRADKKRSLDFAKLRGFSEEVVERLGIFFIQDMVHMLLPEYIDKVESFGVISETNKKPIFNERWVIPILNQDGLVQNLVGYSPEANERYIYGTAEYYRRRETLYGLENLNLAYDMGYAFLTEGITDTIRLRDLGYPNSFAMCGTHNSYFILQQLNRCKHGVILIPDRDDPGLKALKQWKLHRSITLFINFLYKDLDEMCKDPDNIEWFKECIEHCVTWLKLDQHNGVDTLCETVTMV